MEEAAVNKLNVYLVKPEADTVEKIVKGGIDKIKLDTGAIFCKEKSFVRAPDWIVKFFGNKLGKELGLLTSSAKAALVVPITKKDKVYYFVITFGSGRFLLNDGVVEERFGLRVVLNSVNPQSLRSIDKTSLSSIPRQIHEQMSTNGIATDFGIDIEQDLIRSVTGKSKVEALGKTISGKDALSISSKVDITNINEFLGTCLDLNNSKEYKKDFGWVDQIAEVKNKLRVASLNDKLLNRLINRELDNIWMAVPEVIDWHDVRAFTYSEASETLELDDLSTIALLDTFREGIFSLQNLKNKKVYCYSAEKDTVSYRWSAYSCIYAEIPDEEKIYILNNGKWYEIEKDFVKSINSDFASMAESGISLPDYNHENEGSYNEAVATQLNYGLMDKKNISYGGGKSLIEFCDLIKGNNIIHVKRYGGSSVLSHLFAQGAVSGEVFVSDSEFRRKLNEKLPEDFKLLDPLTRPNPADYEITYAIVSKSSQPLNLSFFSKVSLRNSKRKLEGFGYQVKIKKIQDITGAESQI